MTVKLIHMWALPVPSSRTLTHPFATPDEPSTSAALSPRTVLFIPLPSMKSLLVVAEMCGKVVATSETKTMVGST